MPPTCDHSSTSPLPGQEQGDDNSPRSSPVFLPSKRIKLAPACQDQSSDERSPPRATTDRSSAHEEEQQEETKKSGHFSPLLTLPQPHPFIHTLTLPSATQLESRALDPTPREEDLLSRPSDSTEEPRSDSTSNQTLGLYCSSLFGPLDFQYVSMFRDDTLYDLKLDLYSTLGIHPDNQLLLSRGRLLSDDSASLANLGLESGSEIKVLTALRGGPLYVRDLDILAPDPLDTGSSSSDTESTQPSAKIQKLSDLSIDHGPSICSQCSKKLRFSNSFKCKCGKEYCTAHRHAESHACTFDYLSYGQSLCRASLQGKKPLY